MPRQRPRSQASHSLSQPRNSGRKSTPSGNRFIFFKETRVHRFIDEAANTVVYLAWSTRLIDGSPYNAVAVVPFARQP